jgi:hypothetical protein
MLAMSEAGLGVRQVPPRAATRWQGNQRAPERRDAETEQHDEEPQSEPVRPPPTPGTGKLVDRLA